MTARIARGGGATRSAPRSAPRGGGGRGRGSTRSVNTRRARKQSMLGELGFAPGTGRRIAGWIIRRHDCGRARRDDPGLPPARACRHRPGGGCRQCRLHDAARRDQGQSRASLVWTCYNIAFDQPSIGHAAGRHRDTRQRLLRFGWIKEARVQRRLPDTLVIDIVERVPAAIWQTNQRLSLIDAEGVVLEPVRIEAMPELPLVIGEGANRHLATLDALLGAAPHLRPQVAGATWVGGRRWDVRFQTGEMLALPEGE